MKILLIGDYHAKLPSKLKKIAKQCDLIISVGDYGGDEELSKVMFEAFETDIYEKYGEKKIAGLIKKDYKRGNKILNELNELGVKTYMVMGNWDFDSKKALKDYGLELKTYSDIIRKLKNIVNIEKKKTSYKGLKIAGYGGFVTPNLFTKRRSGLTSKQRRTAKKHYKEEKKDLKKHYHKDLDIFVTHWPPYKVFDEVEDKKSPMYGKNIGFKPYNKYIRKNKPKLLVCGHMHEHQGIQKIGKTQVVTVGPAFEGKCAVAEYKDGKFKVSLIK